jgi:hypothetical protein
LCGFFCLFWVAACFFRIVTFKSAALMMFVLLNFLDLFLRFFRLGKLAFITGSA